MAPGAATRGMQAQDLYQIRFAQRVALSPDGTVVAFTVMRPDEASNSNRFSLHLIATDAPPGTEPETVIADEPVEAAPAWSPDGTQLVFVARHGPRPQLWVYDRTGHDIRPLTGGDGPASAPLWSPDGARIAYLSTAPALEPQWAPVAFANPGDVPKRIGRTRYKFDGAGWFDTSRSQLFVMALDSGEARQLTRGATGVGQPIWTAERGVPLGGPAWSHDGTRLAYAVSTDADEERDGRCDVWVAAVDSGELWRVTPNDGFYGCPAWSPDDRQLAVVGARLPKQGGANALLWVVPAAGGEPRLVTEHDLCLGSGQMSDTGAPSRAQPAWIGDSIYCSGGVEGSSHVWRVPAGGGAPRPVTRGNHALTTWSLDQHGRVLVFVASTPTSPGEVYCQRLDQPASDAQALTALNAQLFAEISLSAAEEFWVTTPDGSETRIQGWTMKPPDFSPEHERRYPVILEIHGGPHAAYGASWYHEFQCYAAQGYVIVYCNPRGSTGYGEEFATSIYLDWGSKPLLDVMAALDHVLALGYADPDRLYVAGGSYGGYMVNWVVTHSDRFRAAATGRCVSDLRTLALASDNGTYWMAEYFGGMPWEEPEVYAFGSPISHIAACTTPLLIEHQEQDMRCTMDQAEQMYNALRFLGVETEMVLYPHESHGMSRNGQPRHRVDRLLRTLRWFQAHA